MDADDQLCLMTVHAHPDDEASKGAGSVARAHAEGIRTVLVCCTGGEAGSILNPAMDTPEVRERLAEVRMEELAASMEVIGYDELTFLGYRDSGMPDSPENEDPRCFARAPEDEAVERLVAAIRRHRPQVLVTYGDDQKGYPHPDHLRVHDISVLAFEAAGDPTAFPDAGEPWQPMKLYYTVWSRSRMLAMHAKFLELGLESPFTEERLARMGQDDRITTRVDVSDHFEVRANALLAHRTQIDPNSPFWFGIPPEEQRVVHPYDDYVLARSLVDTGTPEDDLFAGLRQRVG
ncbi:MAG TPA: mycothiol conjugate amidase Mca [Acidimicrobiales bacterium]|nr:mycothiol conjugate amidase Mca [Acidimicrobiales bacterium]